MKNNEKIFGKDANYEHLDFADSFLEQGRRDASKPLEGELIKNERELDIINNINSWLAEECASLGIDDVPLLKPEQFHFIDKNHPRFKGRNFWIAFADDTTDAIYLDKEATEKLRELGLSMVMLHEAIHQISKRAYRIKIKKKDSEETVNINTHHSGYHIWNTASNESHGHFYGLNEEIVQTTTERILASHSENFDTEEETGETRLKKLMEQNKAYDRLVFYLCEKIAEINNESPEDVFLRMEKGLFTGAPFSLGKKIEKIFGKGSLRVIASYGSSKKTPVENFSENDILPKLKEFLEAKDQDKKDKIALDLLDEEEYKKYKLVSS